jgi:hypothetical protein
MRGFHVDAVDVKPLQLGGFDAARASLARRIFDLWKPIFSHLADKDYTFHLHKHVEDAAAVYLRAYFAVNREGADRGLLIMRIHEHVLGGRRIARATLNAGVHAEVPGTSLLEPWVFRDLLQYRILHPRRAFFLVDTIASASAYCAVAEIFPRLRPTPRRPIPDELWPIVAEVAERTGATALPGRPREVRDFSCVVAARARSNRRLPSTGRSRARTAWFEEQTGSATNGMLVIAPLTWWTMAEICVRVVFRIARGHLPRSLKGWIPRSS